MKITKAK